MDEILSRAGIFQGVEPNAASALTSQLQPADFGRGHTVFAQGEPGDRLYIIISGKVKIGNRSPNGQETLLAILGPSDMFGELSVFDPGPRTSSATTITAVRAVPMDRDALRTWIADRPEIAEQLLRVLARRLRRTNSNLDTPSRRRRESLLRASGTRAGGHSARGLWGGSSHRRSPPSETVAADNKLCRRRPSTPGRRPGTEPSARWQDAQPANVFG